ncbi:MAG: PGF-pre-PGF domain-containing protein [Candidatus Hadarchaeota archaeon]
MTDWNTARRFYIAGAGGITENNENNTATTVTPASVTLTNISSKLGQTISIDDNGVKSITVSSSPKIVQVTFNDDQPVYVLTINTDENMSSISVDVEQLSQKPSNVPDPTASIPGIVVSHYMDITVTPTAATSIQVENTSTVSFRVSKSWLSSNNISAAGVRLLRYSSGQWSEKIAFLLEKEDATYQYFTAMVPGFSTFAVAGESEGGTSSPTSTFPTEMAVVAIFVIVMGVVVVIRSKKH